MILAGQCPDVIIEVASRSLSFWDYQVLFKLINNIIVSSGKVISTYFITKIKRRKVSIRKFNSK